MYDHWPFEIFAQSPQLVCRGKQTVVVQVRSKSEMSPAIYEVLSSLLLAGDHCNHNRNASTLTPG